MSKFKNISNKDLTVPGIGIIKAGDTIELPEDFHNANFIRIKIVEAKDIKTKEVENIKTK